jgi:hypothetical protein
MVSLVPTGWQLMAISRSSEHLPERSAIGPKAVIQGLLFGTKVVRVAKCQIRRHGNGPRASESVVLVLRLATLTGPF